MPCFNGGRRGGFDELGLPGGPMTRARRLRLRVFRVIVLVLGGAFFLVPIGAMFEFSTRGNRVGAPRTLEAWTTIVTYPDLLGAIRDSLGLAAITSVGMLVLLLPTMIWVRLRLPRLKRTIEFLCLLPLTIPAIFLLSFAYLILVLPFAYRALDAGLSAIDVKTLSEAARSLGAGWGTVIFRVIAPNMASALLNACLLSVALVLGEFTFANLLSYLNLQVEIFQLGLANAGTSIAVSVASLMFAFILLVILSFFGRPRRRVAPERTGLPFPIAAAGPRCGRRSPRRRWGPPRAQVSRFGSRTSSVATPG